MSSPLTEKQQYWSEQLERAEQSGQRLSEYAKAHGLSAQTLYQWRSALKRKTTTRTTHEEVQFAELVTPTLSASVLSVKLGDATLEFSHLPDPHWLVRLMQLCRQP